MFARLAEHTQNKSPTVQGFTVFRRLAHTAPIIHACRRRPTTHVPHVPQPARARTHTGLCRTTCTHMQILCHTCTCTHHTGTHMQMHARHTQPTVHIHTCAASSHSPTRVCHGCTHTTRTHCASPHPGTRTHIARPRRSHTQVTRETLTHTARVSQCVFICAHTCGTHATHTCICTHAPHMLHTCIFTHMHRVCRTHTSHPGVDPCAARPHVLYTPTYPSAQPPPVLSEASFLSRLSPGSSAPPWTRTASQRPPREESCALCLSV